MPVIRSRTAALICGWLAALALSAGCAKPAPPPPPAPAPPPLPERPAPQRTDLSLAEGIAFAVDDLFIQLQRLPAFAPRVSDKVVEVRRSVIVVDTIIDAATGQQTQATLLAEALVYRPDHDLNWEHWSQRVFYRENGRDMAVRELWNHRIPPILVGVVELILLNRRPCVRTFFNRWLSRLFGLWSGGINGDFGWS